MSPNTLQAQKVESLSNCDLSISWNRVLFTKQYKATLKPIREALSFASRATFEKDLTDFLSTPNKYRFILYYVLRVILHDHHLNIPPVFAPDCFHDAFFTKCVFPCYFLNQCGLYFFPFSVSAICLWNLLISIKLWLHKKTVLSSEFSSPWIFQYYHYRKGHWFTWRWAWKKTTQKISTWMPLWIMFRKKQLEDWKKLWTKKSTVNALKFRKYWFVIVVNNCQLSIQIT